MPNCGVRNALNTEACRRLAAEVQSAICEAITQADAEAQIYVFAMTIVSITRQGLKNSKISSGQVNQVIAGVKKPHQLAVGLSGICLLKVRFEPILNKINHLVSLLLKPLGDTLQELLAYQLR
jgi:hypothetical protein